MPLEDTQKLYFGLIGSDDDDDDNNNNNNNNNTTGAAIYGVEATLAPLSDREVKYDNRLEKYAGFFKMIFFCNLKKQYDN
jgi:hypothetical protein